MKRYPIVLLFLISLNSFSQSGDLYYSTPGSNYVPKRVDAFKEVVNELNRQYDENFSKFYDFYTDKLKHQDKDKNSITYRSQVFALNNFVANLQSYIDAGNWESASSPISSAITKYYSDINSYPEIERKSYEELYQKAKAFNSAGWEFLKVDNYTLALNEFDKSLNTLNNLEALYGKGLIKSSMGLSQEAFDISNQMIELYPNSFSGYEFKAALYEQANLDDLAVENYTKAIELNNSNLLSYKSRGWIYAYSNRNELAINDFNFIIKISPFTADGYFGRAYVYAALKNYDFAISDLKKVIEFQPNNSMAFNNLGWNYFEKKQYNLALENVNRAIDLNSNNYIAYDSRGEINFTLKKFNESINDCSKAIELNPKQANPYFIRGRANYALNNKVKACKDWNIASEYNHLKAAEFVKTYCK
jgi:tetratricopeptide (TPR) repeat protein